MLGRHIQKLVVSETDIEAGVALSDTVTVEMGSSAFIGTTA